MVGTPALGRDAGNLGCKSALALELELELELNMKLELDE